MADEPKAAAPTPAPTTADAKTADAKTAGPTTAGPTTGTTVKKVSKWGMLNMAAMTAVTLLGAGYYFFWPTAEQTSPNAPNPPINYVDRASPVSLVVENIAAMTKNVESINVTVRFEAKEQGANTLTATNMRDDMYRQNASYCVNALMRIKDQAQISSENSNGTLAQEFTTCMGNMSNNTVQVRNVRFNFG